MKKVPVLQRLLRKAGTLEIFYTDKLDMEDNLFNALNFMEDYCDD
jgi:hypothetical protein